MRRIMGKHDPMDAIRLFVRTVWLDREKQQIRVEFFFDPAIAQAEEAERAAKNPHHDATGEGSKRCRVAESWGFEPQIRFVAYTRLAGEHLRPLGQLSVPYRFYKRDMK